MSYVVRPVGVLDPYVPVEDVKKRNSALQLEKRPWVGAYSSMPLRYGSYWKMLSQNKTATKDTHEIGAVGLRGDGGVDD